MSAHLTRRDTGLVAPAAVPEMCNRKTSGQATLVLIHYPTKSDFGEVPDH
jgi:hypothetical protein